jgi:hypothetical protein
MIVFLVLSRPFPCTAPLLSQTGIGALPIDLALYRVGDKRLLGRARTDPQHGGRLEKTALGGGRRRRTRHADPATVGGAKQIVVVKVVLLVRVMDVLDLGGWQGGQGGKRRHDWDDAEGMIRQRELTLSINELLARIRVCYYVYQHGRVVSSSHGEMI